MTTIKKPKKQKLRNAEYYDLQATFDKLYLESKNGKTFTKIMPIILSENNIRLAYRNLKRNSGSKTAGTDNKTIKDLETWKEPDLVRLCANGWNGTSPSPCAGWKSQRTTGRPVPWESLLSKTGLSSNASCKFWNPFAKRNSTTAALGFAQTAARKMPWQWPIRLCKYSICILL